MSSSAAAHAPRSPAVAPRATKSLDETHTDLLRLDLHDVPYLSQGLNVESLRPSLLSRLIGLFIR